MKKITARVKKGTTAIRKKDNIEKKIMLKSVYISRVIEGRKL